MNRRSHLRPMLSAVLAFFLVTAAPLAAQEGSRPDPTIRLGLADLQAAGELRLDLAKILDHRRPSFGLDRTAPAAPAGDPRPELSQASPEAAREAWRTVERAELLSERASSKIRSRGFGKWLKKHWYVPVIVGIGVGALVLDDDDDDVDGDD